MDADDVIRLIVPRFGCRATALAWYRSEPIVGFDGRTAMDLVREGTAHQVIDYLNAVDAGVYA
jgi:uncharacterized protein (DUF2384 family)